MPEQVDARGVGPVRVVEHEDDRRGFGGGREQVDDGVEQQQTFGLGVGLDRGRDVATDPAERFGDEAGDLATVALDVARQGRLVQVVDEVPQGLDPRRVGREDVLLAPPQQHEGPIGVGGPGGLRGEAGLADAGLARHEHDRSAFGLGPLPRVGEHGALLVTPRERELGRARAQCARKRRGLLGARAPPRDLVHGDRLGEALELGLAHQPEGHVGPPAGEPPHQVVAEDLAALGRVTQAAGGHHGGPVAVAVLPGHVARAHADPHEEALGLRRAAVRLLDARLDRAGRGDRLGGPTEGGEDPVAEVLDDPSVLALDRFPQEGVVASAQLVGAELAQAGEQLGAADQVGEEDGRRSGVRHVGRSVDGPGGASERSRRGDSTRSSTSTTTTATSSPATRRMSTKRLSPGPSRTTPTSSAAPRAPSPPTSITSVRSAGSRSPSPPSSPHSACWPWATPW